MGRQPLRLLRGRQHQRQPEHEHQHRQHQSRRRGTAGSRRHRVEIQQAARPGQRIRRQDRVVGTCGRCARGWIRRRRPVIGAGRGWCSGRVARRAGGRWRRSDGRLRFGTANAGGQLARRVESQLDVEFGRAAAVRAPAPRVRRRAAAVREVAVAVAAEAVVAAVGAAAAAGVEARGDPSCAHSLPSKARYDP